MSAGKRRPTPEDLEPLLAHIWESKSLRKACEELGLDAPSTSRWLDEDDGRRQQYERAREGRADYFQEKALEIGLAAATGAKVEIDGDLRSIDATGARVALDAIKWATGRMAPKSVPPTKIDLTSRTRHMTDEEIEAELAAMTAGEAEAAED